MLKEQSSNFEEKILFLKTSIEQEILTKVATEKERETCGLLSNQANLRRDELVLPDNQRVRENDKRENSWSSLRQKRVLSPSVTQLNYEVNRNNLNRNINIIYLVHYLFNLIFSLRISRKLKKYF